MKIAQLKSLIKQGESKILELKSSTGSLSGAMQTVCAFLNSEQGGTIVFGVKDDGKITGQLVTDKTRKEIGIELNKIEPYEKITIAEAPISGDKKVVVFMVRPGEKGPYTYDGRAFIRHQSTTTRMTKEEYAHLYNKHNPTNWESLPNDFCKISDLDRERIKEVVRTGVFEKRLPESAMQESVQEALKKLGLIKNDKLTNAAVILFCKKEDKQFFQSNIKLARFKGVDKSEFLNSKWFKGNAFDLYEKAMDFLAFALPVAARIEKGNPDRIETPAIPYKVLREALINALIHRDYSDSGGSIAVAVYDDRVNISNTGGLPSKIRIFQLSKDHQSHPRNPLIAHVFYVCKKIEKWGRGTLEMIQDCKKAGNPLPIFEEVGGGFSVTLPLKEPIRTVIIKHIEDSNVIGLTERQRKIMEALQEGPLNRQQLIEKARLDLPARTMQWEIAKLKKIGLIKAKGKGKTVAWILVKLKPFAQ